MLIWVVLNTFLIKYRGKGTLVLSQSLCFMLQATPQTHIWHIYKHQHIG